MFPKRFLQEWAAPAGIGLAVAALLLLLFPQLRGGAPSPAADGWHGPVSYNRAVSRAAPAVVNIYTRKAVPQRRHPLLNDPLFRRLFDSLDLPQQERMQSNLGSGVIVDDDGYILTNHHVVDQADAIVVLLADGREAQAQLVGSDAEFDLAVLKIELPELISIEAGEPEKARVGDVVLAIGNPLGIGQTVTQGIISATGERYLNMGSGTGSYLQNFLQTDAAVTIGNSGGALVDARGRLLGINTSILNQSGSSSGGIGFAIPANIAFKVMGDIIEYGRVVPGWLGIEGQTVSPQLARAFNLSSRNGIIITAIYPDGPAQEAGLKAGDVITHIDGLPIKPTKPVGGQSGVAAMATLSPGDTVSITFVREGKNETVQVTVSEKPKAEQRS